MTTVVDGPARRLSAVAFVALRVVAGLAAELLLLWAYIILSNIWTNDDSALAILGFAAVPTGLGLLAAGFAVRGGFGRSKGANST